MRVIVVLFFAAGMLILAGRYWLMPEVARQREAIEQRIGAAIGLPVKIGALAAGWPGFYPRLEIDDLGVSDADGRTVLTLGRVEIEIGWSSIWHMGPTLHRLEIIAPTLDVRRDVAGGLHVAGLRVSGEGDGGFANWLIGQGRIVVRGASIIWHDELRGAPPLELRDLNFDLDNGLRHHRFGLTAATPATIAERLDVRGDLVGRDVNDPSSWQGDLFVDLVKADLAAWKPWVDLPLDWMRGYGDLRLWLAFADLSPRNFTADLQLTDVAVSLRPDLVPLELKHLTGRMRGARTKDGYQGEIRQLELATQDGIEWTPTDARLSIVTAGSRAGGEFRANGFDIGALAALAGHLPLNAEVHAQLLAFAPRGKLSDLLFGWQGDIAAPKSWHAKTRFEGLALAAHKELPGFSGISGSLAGDEAAGEIRIDSRDVQLELPTVFPEPLLLLSSLEAQAGWKARKDGMDFLLSRFDFRNADANGEAAGTYRFTGTGLGEIDLTAKLTDGAGNAVWRYMPLVVNKDARDWLRSAITGGRADSASLRLKGPLDQFPFKDGKSGIFQVKGNFRGATLDYAQGWPVMTEVDGDLLFEGVRMLIRGQRAKMMGVDLSEVQAEIADLETPEEILTVKGRARGLTQHFLDFIEASPVGERIDHFTQPMKAVGKGGLELALVLPLRRIEKTQVQGRYRFADNQLKALPALPAFAGLQGEFSFTSDRLMAKNLRARWLGVPIVADVSSTSGGSVRIAASGALSAAGLRQEFGMRAFEHLSGATPWRATVMVQKSGADILVESNLEGIASSLPDPFNKPASELLPLKVEGRVDAQRAEWNATLGDRAVARLREDGGPWRGRVALGAAALKGAAAAPPARGVALSIAQPRVDVDAWREVLARFPNGLGSGETGDGLITLAAMDLRSPELHLIGRDFHDVQLTASRDSRWRIGLDSREAQGQLSWDDAGAGRITGRMTHLVLPASDGPSSAYDSETNDATRELPAVDLIIDNFLLGDKALGEVRVKAENREGVWQAKLDVKNEAAKLSGEGRWRPSRSAPETALTFRLDVSDAEKLLLRMGLPDAVRRGQATLEGSVAWAGVPFALDVPSLSGQIKIEAEKGQFKKLEPGVGRLLGVLSLQSLPRRITLDFRDIFSQGFAFDSIAGTATVKRGQMSSDQLSIRGPAAKILLSGQANLVAETQDLHVRVQPAIGESIAVGAMIAHPVAGVVAWAAQKMLNDPLDQVFAYEYAVTGSWSDPKVDKLNRSVPPVPVIPTPRTVP